MAASSRMTIGERIIKVLGGATSADVKQVAARAYEAGTYDANDEPVSGTLKSYGYKRLTTGNLRDFSKVDWDTAMETAWTLWQSSPVAKRLLRIKTGYILGGGVKASCDDEQLQEIIDAFWADNQMDKRQKEFTLQLFLFGEQHFPAFVRQSDGRVLLSYIDPGSVQSVVTHPANPMIQVAIVTKPAPSVNSWLKDLPAQVYRIIRKDTEVVDGKKVKQPKYKGLYVTCDQANREPWEQDMLKSYGASDYAGSVLYYKVNSISNQPRGYSDLLQLADWIDQAEETLFALADREQMAGYFSWDVTLTGADEKRVKERAKEIRGNPPKKGSANVHNDAEAWRMDSPDLRQAGTIETYNALLTLVLGGAGFPRHWFGYGDETNRATAEAQGDPTWRTLEEDQSVVGDMLLQMCEFARDQAKIAGAWRGTEGEIRLEMPEMVTKDFTRVLAVLVQLSGALMASVDAGWMTNDTAAEAWAKAMVEIGIDYDVLEEMGEIEQSSEEDDAEEIALQNAELKALLAKGEEEPEEVEPEEEENAPS